LERKVSLWCSWE